MKPRDQGVDWVYSVLPINIALAPVGTFVQLYVLELHGTVIHIGLAITLFSAVSIPAAIIWGIALRYSIFRSSLSTLQAEYSTRH